MPVAAAFQSRTSLRSLEARNALVEANLGLVGEVLNHYRNYPPLRTLPRDDAEQAGRLGLMRAAELYDEERGCRFSTYAWPYIRNYVFKEGLLSNRLIRVPAYVLSRKSPEEVERAVPHYRDLAVQGPYGATRDRLDTLPGRESPGDEILSHAEHAAWLSGRLARAMQSLLPIFREALERRFLGGQSFKAIAAAMGGSKQRAQKRVQGGLRDLRRWLGAEADAA